MLDTANVFAQIINDFRNPTMFKEFYEVVKILYTPVINFSGEVFQLRIEILKKAAKEDLFAKIYRLESYRLQPSFPQIDGLPPETQDDALIYVADDYNFPEISGNSIEDILNKLNLKISKILSSDIL